MTHADDRREPLVWDATPAPSRRYRVLRGVVPAIAALGLFAGATGAGTVASFSSSTDNAANTFSTGTLVLSNSVDSGTACLSTDGGMPANAADCDQLLDVAVQSPGDTASADLDLENVGSMDGDLRVHADGSCTDADAGDTTHHGTGDLCSQLLVSVQQYVDGSARTADDTSGGLCVYGGNAGGQACDFSDPTATLDAFAAEYPDFNDTLGMATLVPDAERALRISVHLPSGAGNAYQGRSASLGFTWRLEQGA